MRRSVRITARLAAFGLAAAFGAATAATAGSGSPIGTWKDMEIGSVIRIFSCGAGICAQLVKVTEPNARDLNNPDPALRRRRVKGIVIMSAVKARRNSWRGKLYNRADGGTYAGSITLVNRNQIILKGCVGPFCKSRLWVRMP
jgi:uncharacterized protein (DUF2147 family)